MKFTRPACLQQEIIILDGIGKCGKSLFGEMITSFERVEKFEFLSVIEYISMAHLHEKISDDIAIAILNTEFDTALYNQMIGRNQNTRFSDDSSIYKYHSPEKYLKRACEQDGPIIAEKVKTERPIFLCWTHDLINKSPIYFEAFGKRLTYFYINRNPIDIMYEWQHVDYSARMAKDPTEMQYCIQYGDAIVPYAAHGWEEEFINGTNLERTVRFIHSYITENCKALKRQIHARDNIRILSFEESVEKPFETATRLQQILGTTASRNTKLAIAKSGCPRIIDWDLVKTRRRELKSKLSTQYHILIDEAEATYKLINALSKETVAS